MSTTDDNSPATTSSGSSGNTYEVLTTPHTARNLPYWRKWACTLIISSASTCTTCTSSIYTSAYLSLQEDFHAPRLLVVSGLSLFVMGLGVGPMFLGPMSEFFGRRIIYLISFSVFTLFLLPCALAPNITVLLIFRFLGGVAGSAFLSVAGGSVGDMWTGPELGAPMMIYTASPFIGPELGPLLGGFISESLSWRWTFWIVMMWSALELGLLFTVPETYEPVLLRNRARVLRKETGDDRYFAKIEALRRSIPATVAYSCKRPFQLLLMDPICLALCTFTAILLGVLYLFFGAFQRTFSQLHGMTISQIGLTFLGMLVGMLLASASDPFWRRIYVRLVKRHNGVSKPEFRLPSGIVGGILVPIGLFWFAGTSRANIPPIVPIVGSGLFSAGTVLVFSAVFTYLVDAYPLYAASALASNSFLRSAFAAGFPLFEGALYERLGFVKAGVVLGALTVVMAPVMMGFFVGGERLRAKSRFAGGK